MRRITLSLIRPTALRPYGLITASASLFSSLITGAQEMSQA